MSSLGSSLSALLTAVGHQVKTAGIDSHCIQQGSLHEPQLFATEGTLFYQSPVYATNHCALTLPLKIDDTFMKNELHTKDYLLWQDAKT